jgi:hypothetical protein
VGIIIFKKRGLEECVPLLPALGRIEQCQASELQPFIQLPVAT